jgi:G:T/U-mismatch repair DNA glycosylase
VSKVLSGIGQSQAIKAQNTAKRRAWERQMEIRHRKWLQDRTLYQAKTVKRAIDINENDLAANRAYEAARQKLNQTRSKALAGNQAGFIKMVKEKLGKLSAAGVTGRSAARYETMIAAAYGREVGKRAFALTRGQEAYRESIQKVRNRALSARNKLTEPLVPVPTLAPNYPPMQNSSMPIFQGILGAAGSAFDAMEGPENNLFNNDSFQEIPFNDIQFDVYDS